MSPRRARSASAASNHDPFAVTTRRRGTTALFAGVVSLAVTAVGCLDRPISPAKPTTTNLYIHTLPNHVVDKADLLFMIDNSMSMADKQRFLAKAVPILVRRLAKPRCLDAEGKPNGRVAATTGRCELGRPEFPAVKDIHVGVITSSLGGHGGTACAPDATDVGPSYTPDDRAELLPMANPAVRGPLDSWNGAGFLAWDPTQTKNQPPGDADLDHLTLEFSDEVQKAGENGCGFEGSLEAWYRFLVDPDPPASITRVLGPDGKISVTHVGPVNQAVLAERRAFLRPDSLLAIVMLTDENDCSIIDDEGSQGWLVSDTVTDAPNDKNEKVLFHLPRAAAVCATSPNDPCCRSCKSPVPAGCPANQDDPECKLGTDLTDREDSANLRCFEQKRRFGIDLLYPLQRYIDGLTKKTIRNRAGEEVPNPIFAAPPGEPARSEDLVLLAGIVGVPWQDIATGDSLTGDGLTYLSAAELRDQNRWSVILGDGDTPAADPLMHESVEPRTGTNPITGDALAPETSTTLANPINGHEQNVVRRDDLQYACTFPLPEARPCDAANGEACDCTQADAAYNRPLCEYPNGAQADGIQRAAKAYPGLRELGVLRGVGDNGIVASICPKHTAPAAGLTEEADGSYGYNPAVDALGVLIGQRLARQCLPRPLTVEADGSVPCAVVEVTRPSGGPCSCDTARGRKPLASDDLKLRQAVSEELWGEGQCGGQTGIDCNGYCQCKIDALTGPALDACQNGQDDGASYGYCYVDPAQGLGDPALVADCPVTTQRSLRFVGDGLPANGSVTFMACIGEQFDDDPGVESTLRP